MSKDKLVIRDDRCRYCIAWMIEEDKYDVGATLGEGHRVFTEDDLLKANPDDWQHIAATMAVATSTGVEHTHDGYYWNSRAEAMVALKMARAALKDKSRRPLPGWALQAKAAGWTPPKGWTP